jgi:hypothetical protein
MLGLVLAVITGTFKEAGSGTTARVSPEQDSEKEINRQVMQQQVENKCSECDDFQNKKASTFLKSVDSLAVGNESSSQLKSDDADNGELMLKLWAQVRSSMLLSRYCIHALDMLQNALNNPRFAHGVSLMIALHALMMNLDDPSNSESMSRLVTTVYIFSHMVSHAAHFIERFQRCAIYLSF